MNDEADMPMSGDGEVSEEPDMEAVQDEATTKREKPLKIRGTLNDVLKAAMDVKPKVKS